VSEENLRVAHVIAGAAMGGAELFFERLCLAERAAGDDVLPVIKRDAARAGRLEAGGLAPVELDFRHVIDFWTKPRLARHLRRFAPRVVVSWMSRASLHTPRGDYVLLGRLGGFYNLAHFRHCDHLVGNTHGLVAWMRARGWPERRTHYLPNFVTDQSGGVPAAEFAGSPKLLLGLGRLHTEKGFDILLRALPALPDARLVLAGDGPERAALMRLAGALGVGGRVVFAGWRQDIAALLAAADVLVCPSRCEPLGNVILEAWSAARPVVAAAVEGPSELIADGVDGALFPSENPDALARVLAALLAAPERARAMAAAGRQRFLADFAQPAVLRQWRNFLSTIER
jgi:glycosyltransferase involved in cell wall biosynthesis